MKIQSAEFLISVNNKENILDLGLNEFVFVGRSNSGKSSLINYLTNRKNLARTSSTPGFTKLINYFLINNDKKNKIIDKIKNKEKVQLSEGFLIVDLPGYGYSKAGKSRHQNWSELIGDYLLSSKNIKRIFVLVDIRHEPSELDTQMLKFLYFHNLPFTVLATKSDKVARSKAAQHISKIAKTLKLATGNIIPCSSLKRIGKNEILALFNN